MSLSYMDITVIDIQNCGLKLRSHSHSHITCMYKLYVGPLTSFGCTIHFYILIRLYNN